jgi:HTH-type transcriptional regulator / antitoxin HigA
MKPKLIKNEREYQMALKRVEKLMDARQGTPQGDELELLATLIELYEERNAPIPPPDPVEAIRFRMQQAGLKAKNLNT